MRKLGESLARAWLQEPNRVAGGATRTQPMHRPAVMPPHNLDRRPRLLSGRVGACCVCQTRGAEPLCKQCRTPEPDGTLPRQGGNLLESQPRETLLSRGRIEASCSHDERSKGIKLHPPGIEPGPPRWQREMITISPWMLYEVKCTALIR